MKRIGLWAPWYHAHVHPLVAMQIAAEWDAAARSGLYVFETCWDDVCGIDLSRNRAIEWAREQRFDWLYMQDSDVYSPGLVVPYLLAAGEENDATVVAAAAPIRNRARAKMNVEPFRQGEVYEGEVAGSGILLISVPRIERIATDYAGAWFERTFEDARQTRLKNTGDYNFCKVVREHGGRLILHAGLPVAHAVEDALTYIPDAGA